MYKQKISETVREAVERMAANGDLRNSTQSISKLIASLPDIFPCNSDFMSECKFTSEFEVLRKDEIGRAISFKYKAKCSKCGQRIVIGE